MKCTVGNVALRVSTRYKVSHFSHQLRYSTNKPVFIITMNAPSSKESTNCHALVMFTETFPLVGPKGWFSHSLHNATKLFLVAIAKRQVRKTRITSWITKGRRQADTALGLPWTKDFNVTFWVLKLMLHQGSDTCFHLRLFITPNASGISKTSPENLLKIAKIVPHSCESIKKESVLRTIATRRYRRKEKIKDCTTS